MALQKEKIVKGIVASYWKIVDCNVKTGFVGLALYINQDAAQIRDNMLDGRVAFNIQFPVIELNPLAYAYSKIKESKKEVKFITPEVEEVKDEEGNIITEALEAVTEEIETNWFSDATDC